ncbi:MAG: sodium:alanine symporter family protein [Phycisphaerales bacterium]|nr:MAG: sodium:alanine symporter family protein [Phycisphaerales bacterium]
MIPPPAPRAAGPPPPRLASGDASLHSVAFTIRGGVRPSPRSEPIGRRPPTTTERGERHVSQLNDFIGALNNILFADFVVYALLLVGLLFTVWSGFGQYRALTHGVSVVRGKYDSKNEPGAINHFQALSTALSATVGLGNIAGVAVAVAIGGPGAILWMWVIGVLGMGLKMTEVTQSMLYRNTDDPDNPHGGPMFVAAKGFPRIFERFGLKRVGAVVGTTVGGIFVITLLTSAITGGNMFQAWNVADVTTTYFDIPQPVTGIVLALLVGMVIIGGIKRIGAVAGRIVPFMCGLYLLAALYVLILNAGAIPEMIWLIIRSGLPTWLGGANPEPAGAFLGATFGFAALWGVKRALFSSEAGQGSAPIAHSAAKTDEPVREGVVAGLEPFIDTIVVCTLTALVILATGTYNRDAEAHFEDPNQIRIVAALDDGGQQRVNDAGVPLWLLETPELPRKSAEARRVLQTAEGASGWRNSDNVFMVLERAEVDRGTGSRVFRHNARVSRADDTQPWIANWPEIAADEAPTLRTNPDGSIDVGIYADYAGASLTAHAFDRVTPGLGKILIVVAAWLFAISTMISWSYYGEQGMYFLCNRLGQAATDAVILIYKLVYCLLILMTTILATPIFTRPDGTSYAVLGTDAQLDNWTTLGLGVMLWANIPLMLIFGVQAMKAYHEYIGKLKRGEFHPHDAPKVTDVVEGKDVE